MANVKVSCVGIEKLWYAPVSAIAELTASMKGSDLYNLLFGENKSNTTEVENVHQDTWTIEESEASQDSYKNQLTGLTYRMGTKTMGEITANFTIGRYDYQTKCDILGGEVIMNGSDVVGWHRAKGTVELRKVLIARTEDKQYVVLTNANINTHEANTDGAIGLACVATALESDNDALFSEYWFDESSVKEATVKAEE